MLISIDYDETFTCDPEFWREVIRLGKMRGHEFVCVTMRHEPPDWSREPFIPIPIVCTSGTLKGPAARKAGYNVTVWVDDMPGLIHGTQMLYPAKMDAYDCGLQSEETQPAAHIAKLIVSDDDTP
jgi:hypothetical protein